MLKIFFKSVYKVLSQTAMLGAPVRRGAVTTEHKLSEKTIGATETKTIADRRQTHRVLRWCLQEISYFKIARLNIRKLS